MNETVTYEKRLTVQRRFPKPRTTINLKNYSIRERKALLFMQLLWEHGYLKEIPHETMENYVERFLGGFRTTKQAYLGQVKIVGNKWNKRAVRKKGLFEKRHWAYFNSCTQTWILNHQAVPLPYHYCESLVPPSSFPLPNKDECVDSKPSNMEKISLTPHSGEMDTAAISEDATASIINKINNNNIGLRERNFAFSGFHVGTESIPGLTKREPSSCVHVDGLREEK